MLFSKPVIQQNMIPPLIVNRAYEFTVCGSRKDIKFWLTPQNIARSSSFVIYDPDGSLREQYGKIFFRNKYRTKIFNPAEFEKSEKYNPLDYIKGDRDIPKLVTAVMHGTKGRGKRGNLNFLMLETALLTALIGYTHGEALDFERNLGSVIEMLTAMEPDRKTDYCGDYKHAVDFLFEEAAERNPDSLYVKSYERYKRFSGRNAKAVVKSCVSRLYPFGSYEARDYFSTDELNLTWRWYPKTVLFVTPGKTSVFDFMIPLMYMQLFDILCEESLEIIIP